MKKLSPSFNAPATETMHNLVMNILNSRFVKYVRGTPPRLLLTILLTAVLLLPVWLVVLPVSLAKTARWSNPDRCRAFIRRHRMAFPDLLPETLRVRRVPGGVSNAGFLWSCRTKRGAEVAYFVKVYLPLGTVWAWLLPWVSPFPRIDAVTVQQRIGADLFAREELERADVAVPRCVAVDAGRGICVSEFLCGRMVNDVLADAQRAGFLIQEDRLMLFECGQGLGRVHESGFSLIDAQPANCMWVPEGRRAYFLDMEYSTRKDERGWDLALFLAFISAQLTGSLEKEAKELVLEGYWKGRHPQRMPPSERSRLLDGYRTIFQAILDLRHLNLPT